VKLLFDANLSPKLVKRLADLFPGLAHVFETGLARFTPDTTIWEYAERNAYIIVTTDADFIELSHQRGFPPKVIRIEKCTFRTAEVEDLIRRNAIRIAGFEVSDQPLLILRKAT
jgi:predicted nuclease of predicted toxin-antitoxin system